MRQHNTGFTLIELVTVIVILGLLAVVAVPQFIDLQDDAAKAATEQVAGNLSSASSINLAGALAGGNGEQLTRCTAVDNLLEGNLDAKYSIGSGGGAAFAGGVTGDVATCVVSDAVNPPGNVVSFQAFHVPNTP